MVYSKRSDDGRDVVMVVVTLDPYTTQESTLHLDLSALGARAGTPLRIYDELSGETFTWGPHPYVRLDPWRRVAHVLNVQTEALT